MAAIALQPARTPAVHVSLSVFTFQTANSMLPRQRRSLARRRGGDGEPVSVLYNGPWFTRSKPRGDGRASSPAEADHELLLVRGGFWHRPKRRRQRQRWESLPGFSR